STLELLSLAVELKLAPAITAVRSARGSLHLPFLRFFLEHFFFFAAPAVGAAAAGTTSMAARPRISDPASRAIGSLGIPFSLLSISEPIRRAILASTRRARIGDGHQHHHQHSSWTSRPRVG